ncbi:MAG TPA: hypothetical protein PK821_01375 [Victivallales bacterium]|nr:hypothetical protein [Victivallales bacterium]
MPTEKKDCTQKNTIRVDIIQLLVSLFCVFSCLTVAVSFIRGNPSRIFHIPKYGAQKKDAEKWFECVKEGRAKMSELFAGRMIDDSFIELPNPDYLDMARLSGLSSSIITGPYSKIDSSRWIDAFESAKIAKEILASCHSDSEFPQSLMKFLKSKFQIQAKHDGEKIPATLSEIMSQDNATVNELSRLASEISRQAGFDAVVVTLHNDKQENIGLLLEIRKSSLRSIIDFTRGAVYENLSVKDLLQAKGNPAFAQNLGAKFARYHIPVEPADFKKANSKLRLKLKELAPELKLPVFAEDPAQRMQNEISSRSQEKIPRMLFAYWNYPFLVLAKEDALQKIY